MKEMIQLIIAMTSLILDSIRDLHALIQDLRREAEEAADTMRELVRSHESSRAAAQDATAATESLLNALAAAQSIFALR